MRKVTALLVAAAPRCPPLLRAARLFLAALFAAASGRAGLVHAWDVAGLRGETIPDSAGNGPAVALRQVETGESLGRRFLRLPGADSSAEVRPAPGDGWPRLTLIAVVHLAQPDAGYQGVVCRDQYGGDSGDVFGLLIDQRGNWCARLTTAAGTSRVAHPAAPGWHQVALVYTGADLTLCVDGRETGTVPASGPVASVPETPLAIASYSNRQGRLRGGVARVEIHDEALPTERLAALWDEWQTRHPVTSFAFAQVSDIHLTDTRSVEIVNAVVDRINADPEIAFSLWLGDLTQSGLPDEMALARLALRRLRQPVWVIPGNHDGPEGGVFEKEFGPPSRRFSLGGWTFFLLDTRPGDATPVAPERLAWLRTEIAATPPSEALVLCTHHPLMPHTRAYRLAGADEILGLFSGRPLRACLAGHYHGNQEEVVEGILFTTTACCSTTRGNHDGTTPRGYRRFVCGEGRIRTEFVPIKDDASP